MDFTNPLFLTLGLCGIVFLIIGYIMLKFPPKDINPIYGYRTKRSMESQEKWDFAQEYASKKMIKISLYMISIALLGLLLDPNETLGIILGIGLTLVACVILIFKTEKKLKQKFSDDRKDI